MFLLVFGRHVGAHLDGHVHGISIQISINLGKKVSMHMHEKHCCDLNLGESLSFFSHILDFIWLNGFDFYFWSILNGMAVETGNFYWPTNQWKHSLCIVCSQYLLIQKLYSGELTKRVLASKRFRTTWYSSRDISKTVVVEVTLHGKRIVFKVSISTQCVSTYSTVFTTMLHLYEIYAVAKGFRLIFKL